VVGLFVTRRRAWIRVTQGEGQNVSVEFAVLARGDDPGLAAALDCLVLDFSQEYESKLTPS
jgi:cytochrome c biogenesis protein